MRMSSAATSVCNVTSAAPTIFPVSRSPLMNSTSSAPALAPGATLVLHVPQSPGFLATEAEYLARGWGVLLHDPGMFERTLLWAPERGAGCRLATDGLACWREGQAACFADGTCAGLAVAFAQIAVKIDVAAENFGQLRGYRVRDAGGVRRDE